jgi:hypothetical protein
LLTLLVLACLPGQAAAATIHVDDDGGSGAGCGSILAPCPTLADAAAIVTAGDLVELATGAYSDGSFTVPVSVRALGRVTITGTLQFGAGGTISGVDLAGAQLEAWNSDLVVRGSRLTGATLATYGGKIDARRNWWGSNAGAAAGLLAGTVDASDPLMLAVSSSSPILVGGSALVTISLVDAAGTIEPSAGGFTASASASGAGSLDATTYTLRSGTASALLQGTSIGTATTEVQLDAARASARTEVIVSAQQATPPAANDIAPTSADTRAPRLMVRLRIVYRALAYSRTRGVIQIVRSNRPSSVRAWLLVSDLESRRLGLRAATDPTHEWFIAGKVRTRAATGTRAVPISMSARPARAARRARHAILAVIVTKVRDRSGNVRTFRRRIMLPAHAR